MSVKPSYRAPGLFVATCQLCPWTFMPTSREKSEARARRHQAEEHPVTHCPACEGTGLVSNCTPLTCNGSHITCDTTDCPDCWEGE